MATWTTQRSGNTSLVSSNASSPWYDGSTQTALNSIPGNGDVIVGGATSHNLTVDANLTIGSNTAAANAISGIGNLTLSSGVLLTLRGNYAMTASKTLTLGTNAGIEFDSSATSPTSTRYNISMTYLSAITATASGNFIRSNAGGGYGYITTNQSGLLNFSGTTFTRMGDTSFAALHVASISTDAVGGLLATDVLGDGCGCLFRISALGNNSRCELNRVRTINSVGTPATAFSSSYTYLFSMWIPASTAATTGTRSVQNISCDKTIYVGTPSIWTTFESIVAAGQIFTPGGVTGFPNFQRVLNVQNSASSGEAICSLSASKIYTVADSSITDNWHSYAFLVAENCTFDKMIWDGCNITNPTDSGELLNIRGASPSGKVVTLKRLVALPSQKNQSGQSYRACLGSLHCEGSSPNTATRNMEHCTQYLAPVGGFGTGMITVGEGQNSYAGTIPNLRGNIAWSGSAGTCYILLNIGGGTGATADIATNANNNGTFQLHTSTSGQGGVGYGYPKTSYTAGANDVTTDPNFVDPYRNIATWATSLSLSGSSDNITLTQAAIDYLAADCSAIATRLDALFAYVLGGQRPRNTDYKAASYVTDAMTTDADGNAWAGAYPDIGAMAWVAASGTFSSCGGTGPTFNFIEV